jgi:hypothetical protein
MLGQAADPVRARTASRAAIYNYVIWWDGATSTGERQRTVNCTRFPALALKVASAGPDVSVAREVST